MRVGEEMQSSANDQTMVNQVHNGPFSDSGNREHRSQCLSYIVVYGVRKEIFYMATINNLSTDLKWV